MRFRHAAVFALVGWYLIAPSPALPPGLAYKEPLRKWQILQSFDAADDCEGSLESSFEQSRSKRALNMLEPAYRDYMFALCIASDDPPQVKIGYSQGR